MKTTFLELFTYAHTMNLRVIEQAEKAGSELPEKVYQLLCHSLNAHRLWNARILGTDAGVTPWTLHPIDTLDDMERSNYYRTLQILDDVPMDFVVEYQTTTGEKFANATSDILFHIVNHGTYHRGQIALLMREAGQTPLATDYIFYKREKSI